MHGVCKKYGGFALRNGIYPAERHVDGFNREKTVPERQRPSRRCLTLIRPDSGEITVLGEHGSNPSVREKIGVVLEDGGFPECDERRTGEHVPLAERTKTGMRSSLRRTLKIWH